MKKLFIFFGTIAFFSLYLINGCKKDALADFGGSTASFTEEFQNVYKLETAGWVTIDRSLIGSIWTQGMDIHTDKGGAVIGFPAYSYRNSKDEYAAALGLLYSEPKDISSWIITPVITVKNGDKFSFYSRGDTSIIAADRLQVRMSNGSSDVGTDYSTVGDFTFLLLDINSAQSVGGYPTTWSKYDYTFTGLAGSQHIRIAFRYYVPSGVRSKMIGIDQFRFEAKRI